MKKVSLALTLALTLIQGVHAIHSEKVDDTTTGGMEVTTQTGLKYVELAAGTGRVAEKGRSVTCHYTIWLPNGKKVDSSRDRQQPFEFQLGYGQVVKGMEEGIAGMKVGGKRKLTIPANLAYGSSAVGNIPANSVLVVEVELLKSEIICVRPAAR